MREAALSDRVIIAEFASAAALRRGTVALEQGGWRLVERYTPYDIDAAAPQPPPRPHSPLPAVAFIAGAAGGVAALLIEWWTNARSYPLNVGGRPRPAVPAYIPIAFESIVLAAALAVVVAALVYLGLPRLWAPIDEVDGFVRASIDRFWLLCEPPAAWPAEQLESSLRAVGAIRVVPHGSDS